MQPAPDLMDLTQAALAGPEGLQPFLAAFCGEAFWACADVKDHVDGKDLVSFRFTRLEGVELPVLLLHRRKEDALRSAGGREEGLLSVPGLLCLSLAGRTRFHLVLAEGDRRCTLEHERLLGMLQVLGLEEGPSRVRNPGPAQGTLPRAFTDALYAYCCRTPDVVQCHLGLASAQAAGAPLPDCLVLFAGTRAARHREAMAQLARRHLPGNQTLVLLDPEVDRGPGRQCAAVLRTFPPFYGGPQDPGWWSRLKGRFSPPRIPWIQVEIAKE